MKIESNYPLAKETTFRCGGKARFYVEVNNDSEFFNLLKLHSGKLFILGAGSKTLCADSGFDGLVISTKKLNKIYFDGDFVVCESGVKLFDLHHFCAENGFSGLEWSYGIPASVGGLAVMNAGAYGHEFCEVLEKVEVYQNKQKIIKDKSELEFGYRLSSLKNVPIFRLWLSLSKSSKKEVLEKQNFYHEKRLESQPVCYGTAGSVFKRINNIIPAKLIENLRLKGYTIGGAEISKKHCNFIVNNGFATATDIIKIINEIKAKVKVAYALDLKEEIIILEN